MEESSYNDEHTDSQNLVVTEEAFGYLKELAKWAHFLAIIGFVMLGFLIIMSFIMGTAVTAFEQEEGGLGALGGGTITIIYLLMGLLYFFPTLYLYRFASRTKSALSSEDSELLAGGFEQLKACFKFMGILMIVMLILYGIMFIAGLGAFILMDAAS